MGELQSKLLCSSHCIYSTLDLPCRPNFAYINFCPRMDLESRQDKFESHVEVAVHEVGHALGFSSAVWKRQRPSSEDTYMLDASKNYRKYSGVCVSPFLATWMIFSF